MKNKNIRNDKNCQTCKIYGKCRWHKLMLDTTNCKHKIMKETEVAKYATLKHQSVNHKYDGQDYSVHLKMVRDIAEEFIYLVPLSQREFVYCGCWVHDIIEDARETYNDVLKNTNKTVAELAYALTNEKGKTRSERANDKYYKEMHEVPNAVFIKLCDRIANIKYSKEHGSRMFEAYKKENENFIRKTYMPELTDMINYISELLEMKEKIYLTDIELEDFDFTGGIKWILRDQTYTYVETIRTDKISDGPSWDIIVKRVSDGKFFKWNCWDTGSKYMMSYGENYMIEVKPKTISKIIYE